MKKASYCEYHEVIYDEDKKPLEVMVQVPENTDDEVHVRVPAGWYSLDTWSSINDFIKRALDDAGWQETKPDKNG